MGSLPCDTMDFTKRVLSSRDHFLWSPTMFPCDWFSMDMMSQVYPWEKKGYFIMDGRCLRKLKKSLDSEKQLITERCALQLMSGTLLRVQDQSIASAIYYHCAALLVLIKIRIFGSKWYWKHYLNIPPIHSFFQYNKVCLCGSC